MTKAEPAPNRDVSVRPGSRVLVATLALLALAPAVFALFEDVVTGDLRGSVPYSDLGRLIAALVACVGSGFAISALKLALVNRRSLARRTRADGPLLGLAIVALLAPLPTILGLLLQDGHSEGGVGFVAFTLGVCGLVAIPSSGIGIALVARWTGARGWVWGGLAIGVLPAVGYVLLLSP